MSNQVTNGLVSKLSPEQLQLREFINRAKEFSPQAIRNAYDAFWEIQRVRISIGNRLVAHAIQTDEQAEGTFLQYIFADLEEKESQFEKIFKAYTESNSLGRWLLSIEGVGPMYAAALMSQIDLQRCSCPQYKHLKGSDREQIPSSHMKKCPGLLYAGQLWSYAGLRPPEEIKWGPGQRRPYNARLRCVILGRLAKNWCKLSCFDKTEDELRDAVIKAKKNKGKDLTEEGIQEQVDKKIRYKRKQKNKLNEPGMLYVRLYMERKIFEEKRNEEGYNMDYIERLKKSHKVSKVLTSKQKEVADRKLKILKRGKLPPHVIDKRALRYTAKIFLSHYHTVGREILGLPVVMPWIMEHSRGHNKYIPPPNWPME